LTDWLPWFRASVNIQISLCDFDSAKLLLAVSDIFPSNVNVKLTRIMMVRDLEWLKQMMSEVGGSNLRWRWDFFSSVISSCWVAHSPKYNDGIID
jgi:hypothetical protein